MTPNARPPRWRPLWARHMTTRSTHDLPEDRRPARKGSKQVRPGDRRGAAHPPDPRLPRPARRGQLRELRSAARRMALEEMAAGQLKVTSPTKASLKK